jgi:hypothetical protein
MIVTFFPLTIVFPVLWANYVRRYVQEAKTRPACSPCKINSYIYLFLWPWLCVSQPKFLKTEHTLGVCTYVY